MKGIATEIEIMTNKFIELLNGLEVSSKLTKKIEEGISLIYLFHNNYTFDIDTLKSVSEVKLI